MDKKENFASRRNKMTALNLAMLVAGMCMLTYASVPLYRIFCQQTGYDGTPKIAKAFPEQPVNRLINIRFDTNIDSNLQWDFESEQKQITVKVGQAGLAFFHAKNDSDQLQWGMATYNITPEKAAQYFNKVHCFCFEKQLIKPGQNIQFPVSFFIDPEFAKDKFMDDGDTITLSYTFYKSEPKK